MVNIAIIDADAFDDVSSMLHSDDIDAVAVCSPTASHETYVSLAAERGKHVFCEKPLAQSIDEADRMIRIVRRNDVQADWAFPAQYPFTMTIRVLCLPVSGNTSSTV